MPSPWARTPTPSGTSKYALGQDTYLKGQDAYSLGLDAFTAGTTIRHQPGYVEKRLCIPCTGCGWRHNQHHKAKRGCPSFDNKRRKKAQP